MAKKTTKSTVADRVPVVPPPIPAVDGGGEPDVTIYVERHDGLIPYLARSAHKRVVWIGGIVHEHVGEHDGCWVYRAM